MKDKYVEKYLKAIKNSVTDDDLKIIVNRIYDDGFQDGVNEGQIETEEQKPRVLMARKPSSLEEVHKETTARISPAEEAEMVKGEKIGNVTLKNWDALCNKNLSEFRFWRVKLEKENELLLIDASGYNYPRYVGLLDH
jgi:hypothetical protein